MKFVGLRKDYASSKLVDWCCTITNRDLYQITEGTPLEVFQQQQKLKWITLVTRRVNNYIMKMLTFHITSNKRLGRKPSSLLERAITITAFGKSISIKIVPIE